MSYSPSPRPSYDGPTHVPYASVTRHLWGDDESGEVSDWIYVSSGEIHQLVFSVPVGGSFQHSDKYRTIFGADEVLYVLGGSMLIANPESGEAHRVETGEAAFFRRDTWHHCFNLSREPLRVLEIFAPPPSKGASGAYAQTKANLTELRYGQDERLEHWPMAQAAARRDAAFQVIRPADLLWRLEGYKHRVATGILASTEHLTVGRVDLIGGQRGDVESHAGDESLYLLEGTLNVRVPDNDGQRWFELKPGDGFYLPHGTPHRYYNMTAEPACFIFGVAPKYLPDLKL